MARQIHSTRRPESEPSPQSRWNEPAGSIIVKGALFAVAVALLAKMLVG